MKYLLTSIIVLTSFSIISDPREIIMGLKKMDKDGNKAISFKEYSHKPQKIFKNMDSNSDGVITYSEFTTKKLRAPKMKANERFNFLDINDDLKVSEKEFILGANNLPRQKRAPRLMRSDKAGKVSKKIFSKLDTNQDNNLDKKELSFVKEIAPQVAKDHSFQNLNIDGDENITIEEFLAPAKADFSKMDSNSNGAIERKEIRNFVKNNKKALKKKGKPFIMQKERKLSR